VIRKDGADGESLPSPEEYVLSDQCNSEAGWREMSPTDAQVILIASKLISQNLSPKEENMLTQNMLYRSTKEPKRVSFPTSLGDSIVERSHTEEKRRERIRSYDEASVEHQ